MVAVRNLSADAVDIIAPGFRAHVAPGEVVEVPDEVAHGAPGVPAVENGEPVLDLATGDPVLVGARGGLLDQDRWLAEPAKKARKGDNDEAHGPDTKEA